ncbi:hypothetical protein NA63_1815 [Flavobacteriaceae bacterium MAR_2010_105]|nr:hypothetical protein NA63_1815 [Flavobacteriaceae bacterium MAR_2010_105]
MKTNFMKKGISLLMIALTFVVSTAFISKNKNEVKTFDDLAYYFFLEYTPGSTSDYSKTRYISSFIYYTGYDDCGNSYDFEPKAKRAFENYIKANYDESYVKHTMTYNKKLNSTDKIKSTQQAREVLDKYLTDQKSKGNQVMQTNFAFSCE